MKYALPDLTKAELSSRRVIIRADLNVPMKSGHITDDTRIQRFIPTLKYLVDKKARIILMTHFGRPKSSSDSSLSVKPLTLALSHYLGKDVKFVDDCISEQAIKASQELNDGDILLLENLRFHEGEMQNDDGFADQLAQLADIYINDAFSCSHRAHASIDALARRLPAFAGPSLRAEIKALEQALEAPKRPVVAIVGGAKISTKIDVLSHLMTKVDNLIIGGAMANTFLAAQDYQLGASLYEPQALGQAKAIQSQAKDQGCNVILPLDLVVASAFEAHAPHKTVSLDGVSAHELALDVGEASRKQYIDILHQSQTCLWNGPLGAFELTPFGNGTFELAQAAATLTTQGKLISIAGGGDTVSALNTAGVSNDFTYISTAGGAFLEWLEGKTLPGIAVLLNQKV